MTQNFGPLWKHWFTFFVITSVFIPRVSDDSKTALLPRPYLVEETGWYVKPANIKVENNGDVVYVGSFLTVHNPLFYD